ncbi:MAG: ABC transporter permease [Thiothrix sp.]|nr:ABC transporter permease [Thiothrix sp.]HPQ96850.1 ABC transporter permease [Thiolinea sp.]
MAAFLEALRVQVRVVRAFILRETRTRFGHSKLGYLWAFFEPMIYMLSMIGIFWVLDRGTPLPGVHLLVFFFTGLMPWLIFTKIAGAVSGSIEANKSLLAYPQVQPVDIVVARSLLEFMTLFLVGVMYLIGVGYAGLLNGIENVLRVLMYLFLAAFLGLGLGLLSGAVKLYWPNWSTFQSVLMRIMFFTSGKFFLADSLPRTLQEWLWYNPMLHVTEGVRSAFFRGFESRFLDPAYPVLCMLLLLFLGLASERVSRGKLMRV